MYTHSHGEQRLIVGVYVDDLIINGGDMEVLDRFKREMSKKFKMSDTTSASKCNRVLPTSPSVKVRTQRSYWILLG